MFDQLEIYHGTMSESVEEHAKAPAMETPMADLHVERTEEQLRDIDGPGALIELARREADRTIEEARLEAERLLEEAHSKAHSKADTIIAERVADAHAALATDLWNSRFFLSDILSDALESIIGERGKPHMQMLAIEKAISNRKCAAKLTVRCSGNMAERLKLLAMGMGRGPAAPAIEIVEDPTLSQASCILETPKGQTEVGLDAQIAAFRRMAELAVRKEG